MLRIIRVIAIEKPWFLRIIIGVIAITFVGALGWVGLSKPSGAYAAKVGSDVIPLADFEARYKIAFRNAEREQQDKIDSQAIKNEVLDQMISRLLWVNYAKSLGFTASDSEVLDAITGIEAFRSSGRFNSRQYQEVLNRFGYTPETFEAGVRDDLIIRKAQDVIAQAAAVSDADLALFAEMDRNAKPEELEGLRKMRRDTLINAKRNAVLVAFTQHMRDMAKVQIYTENIGR